jgi:hypothetical protein
MRGPWITWLQVVLVALLGYSLVLVLAGSVAGALFSALGFGPPDAIDTDEVRTYLNLPFMVLGAVLAGWASMMLSLVRGPLRDGATWVVPILMRSLALWFVLDTAMSVVLGFALHALFNLPFALALAIPLVKLRAAERSDHDRSSPDS